jgi:membrane dipeptidase
MTPALSITPEARQLHEDSIVVVLHDHRPIAADVPLMRQGGVTAKVFQVTLDVDVPAGLEASMHRPAGWLELAEAHFRQALGELADVGLLCRQATTARDIEEAKRTGQVAVLLGTEGSRWLQGDLETLHRFYDYGLRELQLAWAFANDVVPDGRLSGFGRELIAECNRLGVVIDLTHLPPQAFDEVIAATRRPVMVSHGSAAGLTVDLSDEQIRRIAGTGGVLGVHFFTSYLGPNPTPAAVVEQVRYVADLVGIDHVALGVDFFPTDGDWLKLVRATGTPEMQWAIEDLSQMPVITQALLDAGFSPDEVRQVLGLNALRVYRDVIGQ